MLDQNLSRGVSSGAAVIRFQKKLIDCAAKGIFRPEFKQIDGMCFKL